MRVQMTEHGIASSKHFAFLVRRARLLLGLTQSEFAEHFGVETSTVSRWERGLVKPMPKARAEIIKIATRTDPFHSKDIIKASPVFKYLSTMDCLHTPVVISKGVTVYLEQIGYTFHDFLQGQSAPWTNPHEPGYEISMSRCLREIEKDHRWLRGEIAYVEFRGFAKSAGQWAAGLAAPLPEWSDTALVEACRTTGPVGYFIKFVPVNPLT